MRLRTFLAALVCSLLLSTPALAQTDMLNLAQAQIVNAPDVRAWPITTALTQMSFGTNGQTRVEFTKKDGPGRWPDVTPPNWTGPMEYTLWLFVNNSGQWVGSGFIQFWNGRDGSGSPSDPDVPSVYNQHWYYAARWAPIFGHGPIRPGEQIGFMVTSGNARDSVGPMSVQERSNIVVLAATDNGTFNFSGTVPPVTPTPPVPPVGPPAPLPSTDLSIIVELLTLQRAQILDLQQALADHIKAEEAHWDNVKAVWKQVLMYALPVLAGLGGGALIKP